jgi:hypothetical protein
VAAAAAGQPPSTASSARQPWPAWASTTGIGSGLALRCADSGTRAVHTPSCQSCVQGAAVSITLAVSGKKSSFCPRSAAGRPATRSSRSLPSTRAWLPGAAASGWGWALRAASNAAAFSAVVLWIGSCSVKVPSSGMHSLRHTSHEACSWNVTSLASGPGANAPPTVMGTGSSTWPS